MLWVYVFGLEFFTSWMVLTLWACCCQLVSLRRHRLNAKAHSLCLSSIKTLVFVCRVPGNIHSEWTHLEPCAQPIPSVPFRKREEILWDSFSALLPGNKSGRVLNCKQISALWFLTRSLERRMFLSLELRFPYLRRSLPCGVKYPLS